MVGLTWIIFLRVHILVLEGVVSISSSIIPISCPFVCWTDFDPVPFVLLPYHHVLKIRSYFHPLSSLFLMMSGMHILWQNWLCSQSRPPYEQNLQLPSHLILILFLAILVCVPYNTTVKTKFWLIIICDVQPLVSPIQPSPIQTQEQRLCQIELDLNF